MVAEWLRDYVYGAIIGVMFLFLIGSIVSYDSGSGITGYVVANNPNLKITGDTREFKVISFACELTPEEIHVNQGDFVILRFTTYDLTKTKYLFELPSYDIYLRASGKQVTSTKFYADQRGMYTYYVNVPCEKYGFAAKGKLYVH